MSLNTTPRTWVAAEVVTTAELNTEVRDAITGLQSAWTTYTPTWTASTTNPVIGNGSIAGRFFRQGKTIEFLVTVTVGSTTTVGSGGYLFSLPVAALSASHLIVGVGTMFDSSASTDFVRISMLNTTLLAQMVDMSGTRVGAAAPAVPAVGDMFVVGGTYEAA